jgi:hypothetical protein
MDARGGVTRVSPGGDLLLGVPQSPHTLRVEFRPAATGAEGEGEGEGEAGPTLVAAVQLQVPIG